MLGLDALERQLLRDYLPNATTSLPDVEFTAGTTYLNESLNSVRPARDNEEADRCPDIATH